MNNRQQSTDTVNKQRIPMKKQPIPTKKQPIPMSKQPITDINEQPTANNN
jgi:hypothetical protein